MKKILHALLLTGILLFTCLGGVFAQVTDLPAGEETLPAEAVPETEEEPVELIDYSFEQLDVAGVTPMTGNFFCSLWGTNSADMDIQMLLHGYNLVHWQDEDGVFLPDDTVVSGISGTEDPDGNRTFTIALYNDLFYSDGTQITAWDYAFAALLTMSPEAEAIGGMVKHPEYILGYDDYINGSVPYLAGFRVLSNEMLSITVSGEYLPFFYELGLLSTIPYPISVIAPGVRVADDGRGVYLTNINDGSPVFTADLLRSTILDETTGYLSHPTVTSGPYRLVSYENGVVTLEINPYFKGDAQGVQPTIQTLTFRAMKGNEMIEAYKTGEVGLLNKIASVDLVQQGIAAVGENNTQLAFTNYPRTGLGFISFNTERPVIGEVEVRQALAYLIDKDALLDNAVGTNGLRVDGYYGMGQWMFQVLSGALSFPIEEPDGTNGVTEADYEKELAAWEELSLEDIPAYAYDPDAAAALLNTAGWNLNESGTAFRAGTDALRYKQTASGLIPLRLTLAYPEGSGAAEGLRNAAAALKDSGIELSVSELPMEEILAEYYATGERNVDMLFLATNFDIMFDPSANFYFDEAGLPVWRNTSLADQELYDTTVAMRTTEPGEQLEYVQHWLEFQERFNDVLPMLPLYSNVYFDFYPRILRDYNIFSNVSWGQAIVPAYLSDEPEEEETELEGEFEFDDAGFGNF